MGSISQSTVLTDKNLIYKLNQSPLLHTTFMRIPFGYGVKFVTHTPTLPHPKIHRLKTNITLFGGVKRWGLWGDN